MPLPRAVVGVVVVLVGVACNDSAPEPSACARQPVTTESGLTYQDLRCGRGPEAVGGSSVTIRYTAALEDGTQFDSSVSQGGSFVFPLGRGQVIEGLDEGIRGMRVGGARRLEIPPELGYGDAGFPPEVGPDATVVFHVQLVEARQ